MTCLTVLLRSCLAILTSALSISRLSPTALSARLSLPILGTIAIAIITVNGCTSRIIAVVPYGITLTCSRFCFFANVQS